MLDDKNCITQVAQTAKHADQALGIAGMQTDRRFVQYIQGAHQGAAEGGDQVHPLAFAPGEGVHRTVQGKISQAHVVDALQAGDDLLQGFGYRCVLCLAQVDVAEEGQGLLRRHGEYLPYVLGRDLNVESLLSQAASMALGAIGTPAETVLHELELYLVSLGMYPFEEFIDTHDALFISLDAMAVPDNILFLFGQVAVGFKGTDAIARCDVHQMLGEPSHLIASPTGNGAVVDAACLIGHYQIFADAYDFAEAAADGAGSEGGIETEQVVVGFAEGDSVEFEAGAKVAVQACAGVFHRLARKRLAGKNAGLRLFERANVISHQADVAPAAGEGIGDGAEEACAEVFVGGIIFRVRDLQTVHQQPGILRPFAVELKDVIYLPDLSVYEHAGISVLFKAEHHFDLVVALAPVEVGEDVESSRPNGLKPSHDI